MGPPELTTERLRLRQWLPSDREPFAVMNADVNVMQYFPSVLTRGESDALAARIESGLAEHGFGLWAVEVLHIAPFIGFVGLSIPRFEAHFTPCLEIGWRIAEPYWNRGYATEAARAVVQFGFERLQRGEIVSFTAPENLASRRVMEKIGMAHDPADDFEHPLLPEGHALRRHVLYRMRRGSSDD